MVAELANTYVTVYRGTRENQFGDEIDDEQPLITSMPALLAETGKTVQDPSTPEPRTIREITCIVPQSAGVLNTDRIYDTATGDTYMIIGVMTPPMLTGAPVGTVLSLKRVTANTA